MKHYGLKLNMALILIVVLFATSYSITYAKNIDYSEALAAIEKEAIASVEYRTHVDLQYLTITYNENALQNIANKYEDISAIDVQNGTIQFKGNDGKVKNSIDLSCGYADSTGKVQFGPYKADEDGVQYDGYQCDTDTKGRVTFSEGAAQYNNEKKTERKSRNKRK